MDARNRIVLGSRGSELALVQARMVETALRKAWPDLSVAIEIIRTSGDEAAKQVPVVDRKAGRKGMFTREIETQLLESIIDVAVHSAKDLPSEEHDKLEVASTLPRASTNDVLITKAGFGLASVTAGSTVATGSIRRQRQLRWKRPDLKVVDLRGNVPTRLRKLRENPAWSGVVLAQAGLERLGLVGRTLPLPNAKNGPRSDDARQVEDAHYNFASLPAKDFLSAGGQGIVALQVRNEDNRAKELLSAINDRPTHLCLRAEREFLRLLGGDCDSPVGVQAQWAPNELQLRAQVFAEEGAAPRAGMVKGTDAEPEVLAAALIKQIYGE